MSAVKAVSAQQRTFSQQIALFAAAAVTRRTAADRADAARRLRASIAAFSARHAALTAGDARLNPTRWFPDSVRAMYAAPPFDVQRRVVAYLTHARALESRLPRGVASGDPDLEYLLTMGPGPLLASLEAVVRQYDIVQRSSVKRFEIVQLAVLLLGFSTLGGIWLTIFMPMERDIAAKERALKDSATLDPLTAVLNRSAFADRVEERLAQAQRRGESCAMLMIDLDRFKTINDSCGHLAGDRAIAEAAERLRATVRSGEYIARLGGDEFALFAPAIDTGAPLDAFARRMCEALRFEIASDGAVLFVSASIGVACYPADGATIDQLLAKSDKALYAAKAAGRATYQFAAGRPKAVRI